MAPFAIINHMVRLFWRSGSSLVDRHHHTSPCFLFPSSTHHLLVWLLSLVPMAYPDLPKRPPPPAPPPFVICRRRSTKKLVDGDLDVLEPAYHSDLTKLY
mmetsp:Transcript_4999/g.7386  ORF Transcript_4999/g.7386 Transcript_4999/m.7386 type:complete len:100 (+) Transcript_4999:21-320(+)